MLTVWWIILMVYFMDLDLLRRHLTSGSLRVFSQRFKSCLKNHPDCGDYCFVSWGSSLSKWEVLWISPFIYISPYCDKMWSGVLHSCYLAFPAILTQLYTLNAEPKWTFLSLLCWKTLNNISFKILFSHTSWLWLPLIHSYEYPTQLPFHPDPLHTMSPRKE